MATAADMDHPAAETLDGLFRAHYERIARIIGRVIHDQARSEEIAVDVFLKWRRHPEAHGDNAVGWLCRTAVRESLDELRRQSRRSRLERLFSRFRDTPRTPEHLYSTGVEQRNVRDVFGILDRRHVELLLLWTEGLSYAEMAAALGIQPNYAGSLLRRAQEAFRKEYVKRYGK